ncbi:Dat1p KNAG_0G03400 [Huiozyma naganishii CBS 8797]|uniref:Uncharacterized protein n=1 Tax=Huiozyma naganishii (strain ATCC MYA-139 / BCRC 22969 / CBS 8797 / KCTC 17520 / NBRC 10181 / NCYC 3082 / Yp74L-3) TaxID=1071383 RepID=J7RP19_HUIN7|nr:hypothetical protein KNAG_0G03400 [Kazachstania naganishii CBS 8797]CCK71398.1 hypothetical protein KNAG_0G03400 [Kazachstania naganishii CBS 8797]
MAKTLAQGRKPGSGRKPGKGKTLREGRKPGSGRRSRRRAVDGAGADAKTGGGGGEGKGKNTASVSSQDMAAVDALRELTGSPQTRIQSGGLPSLNEILNCSSAGEDVNAIAHASAAAVAATAGSAGTGTGSPFISPNELNAEYYDASAVDLAGNGHANTFHGLVASNHSGGTHMDRTNSTNSSTTTSTNTTPTNNNNNILRKISPVSDIGAGRAHTVDSFYTT